MTAADVTKKTAYYFLYQIEKIGQLSTELLAVRSLFEETYNLHIVTLDPYKCYGVNCSLYEMLTRNLCVSYTDDMDALMFAHRLRGFEETSGIRDFGDYVIITLAPEKLLELCIKKFGRHGWNYICKLNEYDNLKGKALQEALGMPDDAKIVTLHVREPGYLNDEGHFYNYRNADILNYLPAIEYLIDKGYYIVRIGDRTMKPIPIKHNRIIDAPFHPLYADFFEPYFISKSNFYVGMASGPASLAYIFDVYALLTNRVFHWGENGYYKGFSIYKHFWSQQLKRNLSYLEIMTSPALNYYNPALFDRAGITLQENSKEEILRAVIETEARINNNYYVDSNIDCKIDKLFDLAMCYNKTHKLELGSGWNVQETSYMQISHEYIKLNPAFLGITPDTSDHVFVDSDVDLTWRRLFRPSYTKLTDI